MRPRSNEVRLLKRCSLCFSRNHNASTTSQQQQQRFTFPSISFSGAGFLGAYHVGVASCLMKHEHLLKPLETIRHDDTRTPIVTGVSAGAIVSAAISAGVTSDNAMNVIHEINNRTRALTQTTLASSMLDVFTPGFSLVDQLEDLLLQELQIALGGSKDKNDYDHDLFMNRTQNGNSLRIGLTNVKPFISDTRNAISKSFTLPTSPKGEKLNLFYVYVDQYRNLSDVVSSCILSSYIPMGTGTIKGINDVQNKAVKRANESIKDMEQLGFLKQGVTGHSIINVTRSGKHLDEQRQNDQIDDNLHYWDGGIVNMFPTIDDSTIMVTPLNCTFQPNPYISPKPEKDDPFYMDTNENQVSVGINVQNMKLLTKMLRSSSDPSYLDTQYQQGYDDAHVFLKERSLLRVF